MGAVIEYFAYGSNLHPARMAGRAPSFRALGVASLGGHRMQFHKRSLLDGSGKCNIVSGRVSESVFGVIYSVSRDELERLDYEEVVLGGYARVELRVSPLGGTPREVWVYRAPWELLDDSLRPFDWYHALVLAGARHHGLPADHIAALEAVSPIVDTDTRRRRRYDELLATTR